MNWKTIPAAEVDGWNEKLKQTPAPYYQYPYYSQSVYQSAFSKITFAKYVHQKQDIAFAAIIQFGRYPFKMAVLDGGPVLLTDDFPAETLVKELKEFARKQQYIYLQIRPSAAMESLITQDPAFVPRIFFPFHMKEPAELNIYNQPETDLLASFKLQGRRKIVLAGRMPYEFHSLENETQLNQIETIFKETEKRKGYQYTPFSVFRDIYKRGKQHGLCEFYLASLENSPVNAVFIVKDAQCYYHLTSAITIQGFKESESPPAKLHLYAMKDCFYRENKPYYNISHGGSDNLKRFKDLFNPIEVSKPAYYTYVISRNRVKLLEQFTTVEKIRKFRLLVNKLRRFSTKQAV